MKLSVAIITKNEEANLARCLESVSFADEIVLVDSQSTDRTLEIARSFDARVSSIDFKGYGPAKQAAVDKAQGEWILSIDADEEISPALKDEITQLLSGSPTSDGYTIPRRTNFLGRWIGYSGWYPDRVLRLFRKSNGGFNDAVIHEKIVVRGTVGQLQSDIYHYSYPDLESYFTRSNRYTTIGAQQAYDAHKKFAVTDILFRPFATFVKCYIQGQGFRDGLEGFMIAVLSSVAVFAKYSKLRHLEQTNQEHNE